MESPSRRRFWFWFWLLGQRGECDKARRQSCRQTSHFTGAEVQSVLDHVVETPTPGRFTPKSTMRAPSSEPRWLLWLSSSESPRPGPPLRRRLVHRGSASTQRCLCCPATSAHRQHKHTPWKSSSIKMACAQMSHAAAAAHGRGLIRSSQCLFFFSSSHLRVVLRGLQADWQLLGLLLH